jgi:threonine synthase
MTARLAVDHVTGYRCLVCGREYAPGEVEYVCEDHGNDGVLDVQYDYEELAARWDRADVERGPESMWRFRPLLPVDPTAEVPPLRIGWTPLYPTPRLAADLGLRAVWVKDETVEPTGSLKDRASAVAVMRAVRARQLPITTASTGNAAAALAGVCASMGIENVIFVPDDAPEAKIAQLLSFGSTVLLVEGGYDAAIDLCLRAADRFGWYNRTTGFNPHMSEGKKTVAFEIALQLRWEASSDRCTRDSGTSRGSDGSIGSPVSSGSRRPGAHSSPRPGNADRTFSPNRRSVRTPSPTRSLLLFLATG